MSLSNTTKMANRYGLNIEFYEYDSHGNISGSPVASIDFANEVSIELTSELTWATGGQAHDNMIPFKDPTQGTLKISTQVVNVDMLKLAAGADVSVGGNKVSFKNLGSTAPKFYIVKGSTVWQGEDGSTYEETITAYKAAVKPGYTATYNGSGDPQSLDIEFELGTNDNGDLIDFERNEPTPVPAPKFALVYNANGGTGSVPETAEYDAGSEVSVNFTTTPTKSEHTFAGWSTSPAATSATYTSGGVTKIVLDADKTLYAVFVADE